MNSRDVSRKIVEQCLNLMFDFLNSILYQSNIEVFSHLILFLIQ